MGGFENRSLTALWWDNEAKNVLILELHLSVGEKENGEKMYCFSQRIPVHLSSFPRWLTDICSPQHRLKVVHRLL